MKPVSQAVDFSVMIKGFRVPKYGLYGNVNKVYYIWENDTGIFRIFLPQKDRWGKRSIEKYPAIHKYVKDFVNSRSFIDNPVVVYSNTIAIDRRVEKRLRHEAEVREHRTVSGAPVKNTRNQKAIIRYKGSCFSQASIDGKGYQMDWNDDSEGYLSKEDKKYGWNPSSLTFSKEERAADVARHAKITDDPNCPYAKKNSMFVHDTQKCRDKKDKAVVSGEIHSRKVDPLAHGAEYAACNMKLSEEDAIRAYCYGGLSDYAFQRVMEQI